MTIDTQSILYAGRRIAYSDSGPRDGLPVLLCHGLPGAHVQIPDVAVLHQYGVRMIIIDRPGFGRSDPHPGRSIAEWRHDALSVLDELRIDRVVLLPFSAGTPYALGLARMHPTRVSRIHIISGMGPAVKQDVAQMSWFNRVQHSFGHTSPDALTNMVAGISNVVVGKGAKAIPLGLWLMRNVFTPIENHYSRAPEGQVFRDMLAMSFHQGYHSYLQDLSLITGDWGIDMTDIPHPAVCWYGDADKITPPEAGDKLRNFIPQLRMRVFPGVGHLLIFMHWDEVIAGVANEE
jgi:pimeloyl-ACP methyl ester carboxylesterase